MSPKFKIIAVQLFLRIFFVLNKSIASLIFFRQAFNMDQKWDVIIIGGGIIGVSTAYFLAKQNLKVLVLEKNKIGQGCSYGNAGWLTPCFAMPLPMPGMFLKSIKWLLDSNSPLYIKPSLHPDLIFWLLRFLKSMNQKQATRSIEALVQLSQRSLILTKELTEKPPHPTFFQQKGLMMLATSPEGLNDIYLEQKLMSALGVESEKLSTEQCIQREGLLNPNRIIGGVHFLNEATAEPYETVVHLQKKQKLLELFF